MKIERDSWIYRLYEFDAKLLDSSRDYYYTDLCHLIRVLLIWLPLKFMFLGMLMVVIFYGFFIIVPDFSMRLHWVIWSMIAGGFVIFYLSDQRYFPPINFHFPLVFQIAGEYIKAKKQKICPIIEWVEKH